MKSAYELLMDLFSTQPQTQTFAGSGYPTYSNKPVNLPSLNQVGNTVKDFGNAQKDYFTSSQFPVDVTSQNVGIGIGAGLGSFIPGGTLPGAVIGGALGGFTGNRIKDKIGYPQTVWSTLLDTITGAIPGNLDNGLTGGLGLYAGKKAKGFPQTQKGLNPQSFDEFLNSITTGNSDYFNPTPSTTTGKPILLKSYHGTMSDFDKFKIQPTGTRYTGDGIYFTPSETGAKHFAGDKGRVIESFLDLQNPYNMYLPEGNVDWQPGNDRIREILEQGHDSIIVRSRDTDLKTKKIIDDAINEIVVFDLNRIKTKTDLENMFNSKFNPELKGQFSSIHDKQPRFEIDDSVARLKNFEGIKSSTLSDILDHPELYKNYPELVNTPIKYKTNPSQKIGAGGSYSDGRISIEAGVNNQDNLSVLLHEIQHAIQEKEGFARGGSPSGMGQSKHLKTTGFNSPEHLTNFAKSLRKERDALYNKWEDVTFQRKRYKGQRKESDKLLGKWRALEDQIKYLTEFNTDTKSYQRLVGEIEARDVQSRIPLMGNQRFASKPLTGGYLQSQGIPTEDFITRY